MKRVLLAALLALVFVTPVAHAKARYMRLQELVGVSDLVAVIEVTKSEKIVRRPGKDLPKKGFWTYGQKNTFRFLSVVKDAGVIKYDSEKGQTLWAEKSFICARASYSPGRYLVFLESVGAQEWVTLNHQRGALRVREPDSVSGFGWYLESGDASRTVSLKESVKAVGAALLDDVSIEFQALVSAGLERNVWKRDAAYQKLWMDVYRVPTENWPAGLRHFARAFLRTETTKREDFERLVKNGGRAHVKARWVLGSLIIDRIQPIERD